MFEVPVPSQSAQSAATKKSLQPARGATAAVPPTVGVGRLTRSSLFRKYLVLLGALVGFPLLASGALQIWSAYQELDDFLARRQREHADAAAGRIDQFISEIEAQIGWMVQLPWSAGSIEQRRFDARRLLKQVPAITEVSMIDGTGHEQVRVSRLSRDEIGSGSDFSADPRFAGARADRHWFAPVYFRDQSEPYMSIALAGNRKSAGVSIAEVNLKFIWDIVSRIQDGSGGTAYVVDRNGRLIAHPDIALVLKNTSVAGLPQVRAAMDIPTGAPEKEEAIARNLRGQSVFSARAGIEALGWWVFVELPVDEAYAPIYAAMRRSGALVAVGLIFAVGAAFVLARRMVLPIRRLQDGARRIGEGDFAPSIDIRTGDELEDLAHQFNRMGHELGVLYDNLERINQLKRYFSPQLAEMIVSSTDSILGASHRRDITVVFCDLRNFTAFSTSFEAEVVIQVLGAFYRSVGGWVRHSGATIGHFGGDGLMAFFNDPLPCADHQLRAAAMAAAMRRDVAGLARDWRARGMGLGFAVGIASGEATLGDIGSDDQFNYTAIGPVVNLASRLCDMAGDGEILLDDAVRAAIAGRAQISDAGARVLKGFPDPVPAFRLELVRGDPVELMGGGPGDRPPGERRHEQ